MERDTLTTMQHTEVHNADMERDNVCEIIKKGRECLVSKYAQNMV